VREGRRAAGQNLRDCRTRGKPGLGIAAASSWFGILRAAAVECGDYRYRGHVVRSASLVINSTIVHRSTCWITDGSGERLRITGNSKSEIEAKIDALIGPHRPPALVARPA
jgi:hypothetical protein